MYRKGSAGYFLKRKRKLLDQYSGAAAAYSLRGLSKFKYYDPVIRVRRASDNEERDFTASEVLADLETWANSGDLTAPTGGAISVITDPNDGKQYRVHTFTSDGTFVANGDLQVQYLIVGGGGPGAGEASSITQYGGGGGAGGVLTGTSQIQAGNYSITVGLGGEAPKAFESGENGEDSTAFGLTAIGGGAGGTNNDFGRDGGSGGGKGSRGSSAGSGVAGQGNDGGARGGGGAGQIGDTNGLGSGGDGIQSNITGNQTYYGGGGCSLGGDGGLGGGGGPFIDVKGENAIAGQDGTGGGGAGAREGGLGGKGGSGIVIVRYAVEDIYDAFVTTWYDQSGNDNHATQTTATDQPKIVDAGTLVTENGKAAVKFGESNSNIKYLDFSNIVPLSYFTVSYTTNNGDFQGILNRRNFDSNERKRPDTNGKWEKPFFLVNGSPFTGSVMGGYDIQELTFFDYKRQTIKGEYVNRISRVNLTRFWNGTIQEIIIYPSDQSNNRTAIESNINSYYNIF